MSASEPARLDVLEILQTGDLSRLNDEQQTWYYLHECQRMGLDPAARPLEWARLQGGKLTLYARRVAGDMLAAKHRVSVVLIAGPEVRDFGGTKLLYAAARAMMPDGRSVEDVATLPLSDLVNAVMKVVTKAFRRATLRLCGWGGLDESELDTMRASAASPAPPREHPALTELLARLTDGDVVGTLDVLVQTYDETVGQVGDHDVRTAGLRACYAHLEEALGLTGQRVRFKAAVDAREHARAAARRAAAPLHPPLHPVLDAFALDLAALELPGECVALWIKHRGAIKGFPAAEREQAWRELCKRTEAVGKMKNAKAWLKRAIEEEDARAAQDGRGPPEPPRGGGAPAPLVPPMALDVHGDAYEGPDPAAAPAARSLDAFAAYLAGKSTLPEIENGFAAHTRDYDASEAALMRVAVDRLRAVAPDLSEGVAVNRLRIALNARAKRARRAA